MRRIVTLKINGEMRDIIVEPRDILLEVLRDQLGLKGTKRGCGVGTCGFCTVLIDGKAVLSCLTLAIECEGHSITTIEDIGGLEVLHPIQNHFIETGAIQCGFCTPGIVMTVKALLDANPNPNEEEIKDALSGTFCRCTGYIKIIEAVKKAAESLERKKNEV